MPKYRVTRESFVDGNLIDSKMIEAAGPQGYTLEFDGYVGPGDVHLQLIEGDRKAIEAEHKAKFLAEAVRIGVEGLSSDDAIETITREIGLVKQRTMEDIFAAPAPPSAPGISKAEIESIRTGA
jgi:hypothetical protein